LSLVVSSGMASAAGTIATSAGAVSMCSSAAVAATAAAAQAARPGCVLPAVDAAAPLPVESGVVGTAPAFGGVLIPLLGLAALAGLLLAINSGDDEGSGSLSRG